MWNLKDQQERNIRKQAKFFIELLFFSYKSRQDNIYGID